MLNFLMSSKGELSPRLPDGASEHVFRSTSGVLGSPFLTVAQNFSLSHA